MSLNPNYVDRLFGWVLICAGDANRAIGVIHAYMRLDPFYIPFASWPLGYAHYMLGHYWQALPPVRDCAATLARIGHFEEARVEAAEVLRLAPGFTISDSEIVWCARLRSSNIRGTKSISVKHCATSRRT